jgi:hypothetical protein
MLGMKTARPKLVTAPAGGGYGSAARAELALAIAERQAAEGAVANLASARERLSEALGAAFLKIERAKEGIEDAKTAASSHMLATAIGAAGDPPMSVSAARAALQAAEDEFTAAQAARGGLNKHEAEVIANVKRAEARVREAAMKVVSEAAPGDGLLEEVRDLQRRLINRGRLLTWLMKEGILPDGGAKVTPGPSITF